MDSKQLAGVLQHLGFNNIKEVSNSILKKRKLDFGFSFTAELDNRSVDFLIGFNKNFPLSMPNYFINSYDTFDFIPHVERDGKVCYTHDDYVYLDANAPDKIISETYDLAKTTILKGLKKENILDFANEFEAYWDRIDGGEDIFGNMLIPEQPTVIKIGVKEATRFAVSDVNGCVDQIHRFMDVGDKGVTYYNSVLIPFHINEAFLPPKYNEQLSHAYIKNIYDLLEPKAKKALEKITAGMKGKDQYVLFTFRQPNGNNALFGVKFSNYKSSGFPVLSDDFEGKITPVHVIRLDKDYLFRRGSIGRPTFDKKGLIIGGGSVGGFISEELIRSGFLDLTIVDADNLSGDNCYRHLTGFSYMGKNKAEALKKKLESYFPHCNINGIAEPIEDLISKNKIKFSDYDFIVVATGNVTINVYLNELLKKEHNKIPVFYSWNDPYGIGGHCLVVAAEKPGCYNCLYSNEDFYNTASFAAPKQSKSFLKAISGCGSIYTPYGSIDSMQTCLVTVRKIIEVINHHGNSAVYSWKGDPEIFIKEGFVLSPRFEMTDEELNERKRAFINEKCKVCQITQ